MNAYKLFEETMAKSNDLDASDRELLYRLLMSTGVDMTRQLRGDAYVACSFADIMNDIPNPVTSGTIH